MVHNVHVMMMIEPFFAPRTLVLCISFIGMVCLFGHYEDYRQITFFIHYSMESCKGWKEDCNKRMKCVYIMREPVEQTWEQKLEGLASNWILVIISPVHHEVSEFPFWSFHHDMIYVPEEKRIHLLFCFWRDSSFLPDVCWIINQLRRTPFLFLIVTHVTSMDD